MPRSPQTLLLNSAAHALGDEYYRRLTSSIRTEANSDPELIRIARDYLRALEKLREHLEMLTSDPETSALKKSTQRYIDFVRKDIRSSGAHTLEMQSEQAASG